MAEDQRIFIRKAFLGRAETPPYQVLVRTKEAELWKEGAGRGVLAARGDTTVPA
jgi:hypothetical protein